MPFHAVGTLIGCANHEVDEAAKHVRDLTEALIQADKDRIPGGGRVAKALDEIKEGYETRLKNQAASIENLQLIRRELLALAEELFDGLNGPMIIMPEHMSRLAARLKNHQEGG